MKKLVLATFIAAFAAGFQTFAAVGSLPIGSVEKVLNQYLIHTDQIWINLNAGDSIAAIENNQSTALYGQAWTSYVKGDGTSESINALCQRVAATPDKSELNTLIGNMLRVATATINNWSDPSLQGKVVMLSVNGLWQPGSFLNSSGTFSVWTAFTVSSQGIPNSAYEVNLTSITKANGQAIFVDGDAVVTGGEVRDDRGNLIDTVLIQSWATNAIVFRNEVLSGQPGTVLLRFADGTTQTFSLTDGSLVSALTLKIGPVTQNQGLLLKEVSPSPSGVKLTVVSAPGVVNLEYADSFGGSWLPLATLQNYTGSVEFVDVPTNSARFYRAHIGK